MDRMRINNEDLLEINGTRATISMGTSFNTKPIWLGHICNFSIQLVFTGTPNGTFTLQLSNDLGHPNAQSETQQYADVTNWTTITDSAQPITAAGDHTYQFANAGFRWVRVVWTQSSSTGTLTIARCNVKGS